MLRTTCGGAPGSGPSCASPRLITLAKGLSGKRRPGWESVSGLPRSKQDSAELLRATSHAAFDRNQPDPCPPPRHDLNETVIVYISRARAAVHGLAAVLLIGGGVFLLLSGFSLTDRGTFLTWGSIGLGTLGLAVVVGQVVRTGHPVELDASGGIYRWGFARDTVIDWSEVKSVMPLGKRSLTVHTRSGKEMQWRLALCDLSSTTRTDIVGYMSQLIGGSAAQPASRLRARQTHRATYSWKRSKVVHSWGPRLIFGAGMSFVALIWLSKGSEATRTSLGVLALALPFALVAGFRLVPALKPKPFVVDSSGISIPRGQRIGATVVEWPNVMSVTRKRTARDVDLLTFDVADSRPITVNAQWLHEHERFIADIEDRVGYEIPFV